MDGELIRLSAGAFLTSAGFGGTAALGAAVIAYRGISARIRADRAIAAEAEARTRWWEALMWLWDNHTNVPVDSITATCDNLNELADTEEQNVMLEVVQVAIFSPPPLTPPPPEPATTSEDDDDGTST